MNSSSSSTSIPRKISTSLVTLARADSEEGINKKFVQQADRAERFSFEFGPLFFDFSKTHLSSKLLETYGELAKDINFDEKRAALFRGDAINTSEGRSVLHTLLRSPENHGVEMNNPELAEQARNAAKELDRSYRFIRDDLDSRSTPVRDIIHVGIGGSSLGTQLVFEALKSAKESISIHFVANIDAHQLKDVLAKCDASSTIVFGVSKTFTTAETLQNIRTIGDWFEAKGNSDFLSHVIAITANADNAKSFGVPKENTVVFPEWVGGRYSLWSAVSLSAAVVLGIETFEQMLLGGAAMDAQFLSSPPEANVSFIAAALDHYYVNFMGSTSRATFAYDFRLRSLVSHLQQLETESNGKDRQLTGEPVDQRTSPVVWGGVGTDVQHSVFQMLHQGTSLIPAEFILTINPDHDYSEHHSELLANGLAQPAALLAGQSIDQVRERHAQDNLSDTAQHAKIFSGERPSTSILIDKLDAYSLGAMLAFYEHRTFCYGVFCNINSFDQMGVELGKRLAKELSPLLKPDNSGRNGNEAAHTASSHEAETQREFDPSTAMLLARIKQSGED